MKKKKSSKLKKLITLVIVIIVGVLFYKFVIKGNEGIFTIESSSSSGAFGSPQKSEKKELDSQGHTEDFWTNNKFKW